MRGKSEIAVKRQVFGMFSMDNKKRIFSRLAPTLALVLLVVLAGGPDIGIDAETLWKPVDGKAEAATPTERDAIIKALGEEALRAPTLRDGTPSAMPSASYGRLSPAPRPNRTLLQRPWPSLRPRARSHHGAPIRSSTAVMRYLVKTG